MAEEQQSKNPVQPKQNNFFKFSFLAIMVLLAVFAVIFYFKPTVQQATQPQTTGLVTVTDNASARSETSSIEDLEDIDKDIIDPADFPIREEYFRELFRIPDPRSKKYRIFEKAAKHLNKDIEGVKDYFNLNSEEEIFENIPYPPPDDFSNIMYDFAIGRYFAIGLLGEEYFMQPEFYPNFKSTGIKTWTEHDSRYWSPHGFGSYPSVQYDALSLKERTEGTGVVFVHPSWGVQTHQGFSLLTDSESPKYFDITITPQNFKLGPAWPKFAPDWVRRVVINFKLKPGTPPGTYKIMLNVFPPPADLKEQWQYEYKNVYFDAAVSPVRPEGNFIEFIVTVAE